MLYLWMGCTSILLENRSEDILLRDLFLPFPLKKTLIAIEIFQ